MYVPPQAEYRKKKQNYLCAECNSFWKAEYIVSGAEYRNYGFIFAYKQLSIKYYNPLNNARIIFKSSDKASQAEYILYELKV